MDAIEEIDAWYAALSPEDKLRFKHPDAIAKSAQLATQMLKTAGLTWYDVLDISKEAEK